MTLYELSEEYRIILELAEDPEVSEEVFQDTLEAVGGEIEVKADGYAKVMKQMEADIAGIKEEETRLKNRRLTLENNIKRMKDALQAAMSATGKTKFKTELFSFGIQKNPESVVITDESVIPECFLIPQQPKIDKAAIKDHLKKEGVLAWAHLEQSEGLRIR